MSGGKPLGRRVRLLKALGRVFHGGTAAIAVGLLALVAAVVVVLARAASQSLRLYGLGFLGRLVWDPVHNIYGALPAVTGTVLTSALALLIAVPLALGVAVFLSELAPVWLREPLSTVVDLSAAIPSVVYGFWGFIVLVPIMRVDVEPVLARTTGGSFLFSGTPIGLDVLTASVVLAVMVLPTISALSRAALQAVPRIQREAALSLGATRAESTRLAVLGPARSAILGGVLLGLGRALGETMAVTMTIGNRYAIPTSLFSPGQSIASQIANDLNSAGPLETSALVELGLVLLLITLVVNIVARLLMWKVGAAGTHKESARGHRREAVTAVRIGSHRVRGVGRGARGEPLDPGATAAADRYPEWRERVQQVQLHRRARRRWVHRVVFAATLVALVTAIAPLVAILWTAIQQGGSAVLHPSFYTGTMPPPCNPATGAACSLGGIGPAIQGTLILVGLASLLAVPLGVLAGIYLSEYGRNRLGPLISFFADVMTGFPSILIGLFVFVLFLDVDRNLTFSAISGTVALGILMIPIVARATEEALKAVPVGVREAGLALGFPRHRVTLRVVLGTARNAIVTGILLAVARAGGETAALIMTAFGSPFYFQNLNQPTAALPPLIYNLGLTNWPNWQQDAWGATLVLVVIMLAISLGTRIVVRRPGGAAEAG